MSSKQKEPNLQNPDIPVHKPPSRNNKYFLRAYMVLVALLAVLAVSSVAVYAATTSFKGDILVRVYAYHGHDTASTPLAGVDVRIAAVSSTSNCQVNSGTTNAAGTILMKACPTDFPTTRVGRRNYHITSATLAGYQESSISHNKVRTGSFKVYARVKPVIRTYYMHLDCGAPDVLSRPFGAHDCPSAAAAAAKAEALAQCSQTVKCLAQQMLANNTISYWTNNGANTRDVVVALAAGRSAFTTCANATNKTTSVNPDILKAVLEYASTTPVMVNALTDKCHSAGSNHYVGKGIDFECGSIPLNVPKFDAIAAKFGGARNSETCAATNHWHYDFL